MIRALDGRDGASGRPSARAPHSTWRPARGQPARCCISSCGRIRWLDDRPNDSLEQGRRSMRKSANARFAITNWDEKPIGDDQPKLTRASVTKTLTGDIEGESHVE